MPGPEELAFRGGGRLGGGDACRPNNQFCRGYCQHDLPSEQDGLSGTGTASAPGPRTPRKPRPGPLRRKPWRSGQDNPSPLKGKTVKSCSPRSPNFLNLENGRFSAGFAQLDSNASAGWNLRTREGTRCRGEREWPLFHLCME